jgi:hypothetical protein
MVRTDLQLRRAYWLDVARAEDALGVPDHLGHPLAARERERDYFTRDRGIPSGAGYLGLLTGSVKSPRLRRLLRQVATGLIVAEEYRELRKAEEEAKRVYH